MARTFLFWYALNVILVGALFMIGALSFLFDEGFDGQSILSVLIAIPLLAIVPLPFAGLLTVILRGPRF